MELEDLSIRARVGLAALCLEDLLKKFVPVYTNHPGWVYILNSIWEYTSKSPGEWHNKMAEINPLAVEEEVPFDESDLEYLDKETFFLIRDAYSKTTNKAVKNIIDLIFEIGTLDLYSSIHQKSPRTLSMLKKILDITLKNGVPVPSLDRFVNYDISKNDGWGVSFNKSDVE